MDEPVDPSCSECGEALPAGTRYCVECGARRGPLPEAFLRLIGRHEAALAAPAGAHEPLAVAPSPSSPPSPPDDETSLPLIAMPSPRAAATAVLAVLAFGVVIGTLVGPPADSAASSPLVVAVQQPPAATPTPTPAPTPARAPHRAPRRAAPVATAAPTPEATPVAQPAAPPPIDFPAGPPPPTLPAVHHVFLIVLADHGYDAAFGPDSQAPYLAHTLTGKGELLPNYYAVASGELANTIGLLSGQGPTAQIAAGCPTFSDVTPGTLDGDGLATGDGCVYPATVPTLTDQLTIAGSTWKSYVQSMDTGLPDAHASCRHPDAGAADPSQTPAPGDPYVTWRNPLVYFHSVIDVPSCAKRDVDLDRLGEDLKTPRTTPTLSVILPDRCHDGSETPCAPDAPAGLAPADDFLRTVVPEIQKSAAYRDGGLIAITFDRAPQDGPDADSSSCCDQPDFTSVQAPAVTPTPTATPIPGATPTPTPTPTVTPTATATPAPTGTATPAPGTIPGVPAGGGRVGLLLISPFVKAGTVDSFGSYNHFSLLASIEDLFGLDRLGYAADPALPVFDRSTYNGAG